MRHSLAYIKAINVLSPSESEELKLKISQVYPEVDFQGMAYNNLTGTPVENLRSLKLENPVIDNLTNFSKMLLVSNMALNEDELKDFLNIHVKGATSNEIDKAVTRATNAYEEDQEWGRVTVVYKNEWEQMLKVLDIKDDVPA